MNSLIYVLLIIAIVVMGVYFKMYPVFPLMEKTTRKYNFLENYSNPSVSPNEPTCVRRNIDAQALLEMFPQCTSDYNSPSEDALNRIELKHILNKLTCLDADVSNSGVSGYNTLYLKYNTSHDTEPLTNFVGRCLNGGARTRDIDIIMSKYESRGNELLKGISSFMHIEPTKAYEHFRKVIKTTYASLINNCKMERASLDKPAGIRDPGYMIPFSVETLGPFSRTMD